MRKHKLVIASNRLPVNVSRENGKLIFEPSSGGLATAMSSLKASDKVWVGWPGIPSDDLTDAEKEEIERELRQLGCYPVYLTSEQVQLFYEGYSNDTLWPLFHYFQSLAHYDDHYWSAYQHVNNIFAEAIVACAEESASIWVHDYHLMTTPALLRKQLANASIGFFLHIPFPSFEIYRLLPQRKEILRGLLGADLIGFHIYDYARHFLSSCLRLLGLENQHGAIEYDGRTITTDAYPIGIDYTKFRTALKSPEVEEHIQAVEENYKDQKLILSVDRLDYSKGIPERLDAFSQLLEKYPEYIGRVRLMMIAVPSRTEVETYQNLRDSIEQSVSRINGMYGTVDWAPISYQFQNRPFDEIVALYSVADVALVTPIRDGMNLVAKEYVASKSPKQGGVLILSEMTGAIDELPEALSINPNDTQSVTDAIHKALTMSKREQQRRLSIMQRRLRSYTVQAWGKEFMHELKEAGGRREHQLKKRLSPNQRNAILRTYQSSSSRLILLDYDGTLTDFVSSPNPDAAKPSQRLLRIITKLANNPANKVAIVSGRPRKTLERWFKGVPVMLAAEHGAWTRYDSEWSRTDIDFMPTKHLVRPTLEKYVSRTAGAAIEEKDYSLVWHYRKVPPELAYVRATELRRELSTMLETDTVGVYKGEKILEIKPTEVTKGHVATELEAIFDPDFTLCIGDDYTDEDMFQELDDDAITIKVGGGETKARYQLRDVAAAVTLLDMLSHQ